MALFTIRHLHEVRFETPHGCDVDDRLMRLEKIMAKISDVLAAFKAQQEAYNAQAGAALDKIVEAQTGLTGDIAELNRKITELQNSAGEVTPADQAIIDELQAQAAALASRADGIAAALAALDELTPPAVPAPPPDGQ